MNKEVQTLWLWDTLPKEVLKSEEQTLLNEGDAVENVDRLALGIIVDYSYKSSRIIALSIRIEEKYN